MLCFFKRAIQKFELKYTCVGINWIGRVMLWNQYALARNFHEFKELHLTFHVGNDKAWKNPVYSDYVQFNYKQAMRAFEKLSKRFGLLNRLEESRPEFLTAMKADDITMVKSRQYGLWHYLKTRIRTFFV